MKRSDLELELEAYPDVYVPRVMHRTWVKTEFLLDAHKCDTECKMSGEVHLRVHLETIDGYSKEGKIPAIFFSHSELIRLHGYNVYIRIS